MSALSSRFKSPAKYNRTCAIVQGAAGLLPRKQ